MLKRPLDYTRVLLSLLIRNWDLKGTTTFSITTLSITTLSKMILSIMTLSIMTHIK